MRKLLKSLACFATAALVGASAFANYDWYDTSIGIGGIKSNFQDWSRGNGAPDTDLGALTSLTLSSVEMNIWDDDNDRGGVNMFFRLYGDNGQIGGDVDVWLGGAERIEGSVHDFSVSYTGPFDLADAFGVTLEDGKTYYLNMWAKSYGPAGDHWYSGDGDNYHTKFVYCGTPKTYTLVESADDLVVGADYLVVSTVDGAYSAMKNEVNGTGLGCLGLADDAISGNTISAASDAIVWRLNPGQAEERYQLYSSAAGVFAADSDELAGRAQLLANGDTDLARWTVDLSALPDVKFYSVSYPDRCLQRDNFAANERFAAYDRVHVAPRLYRDDSTELQTVTFDANGGTSPVAFRKYVHGTTYWGIRKPTWTGEGTKKFLGWFDAREGGKRVTNYEDVTDDAERTLYAHWGDYQTVYFDANGGSYTKTSVSCAGTYSGITKPTWTGEGTKKFLGWFDSREGGVYVTNGQEVTGDAERTLYAHWGDYQTVYFDANGGSYTKQSVVCAGTYTGITKPTWTGEGTKKFLGWFDAREGGVYVTNGQEVTGGAERTLYAHWGSYQTVYFDANGGSYSKVSVSCAGTYSGITKPTWTGEGTKKFLGWFDAREGGVYVTNGHQVTDDAERTLYAHWADAGLSIAGFSMSSRAKVGARAASTVTDTITAGILAATNTTYAEFSGVDKTKDGINSDAVYAGKNSKNSNGAMQLRISDNSSGIVTTGSGGAAKSVTVVWQTTPGSDSGLYVYGKTSSYSAATDLYDSTKQGTLLGTITSGTAFEITGDYTYIGLKSKKGTIYPSSIAIEWTVASSDQSVTLSPAGPIVAEVGDEVIITATADGFSGDVIWSWTGSGTPDGNRFTVDTSAAVEAATITATATYGTDETASQSVTVTVTAPKHAITIDSTIQNGTVTTDPEGEAAEGATVTVTASPASGYKLGSILVNDVALAAGVNTFTMPSQNVTVSATFVELSGDVLTQANTTTTSGYTSWTLTGASGTKYAGISAGGNSSIQLNTATATSKRGIVITESTGRNVASVTVDWNVNTGSGRSIAIYGSTEAYDGPADLHGDNPGDLLGELKHDDGDTTLNVTGDYPYIGIVAKGGALYLNSVTIEFAPVAVVPTVTVTASATEVLVNTEVTFTATAENFDAPASDLIWEWKVGETLDPTQDGTTFTWTPSAAGTYTVTATATDGDNIDDDSVTVTVNAPPALHDVVVMTDGNGTAEADVDEALPGTTVTVTATPNADCRLDAITVNDEPITGTTFEMPNEDVLVYVTFEAKHDIEVFAGEHGQASADMDKAYAGETVTLTVTPDAGYAKDTIKVNDEVISGTSFEMPAEDALVEVTFKEVVTYTLVESEDDFVVGADYLIVAVSNGVFSSALKNEANGTRIGIEEVEIDGNTIANGSAALVWQINPGQAEERYQIYNAAAGVFAAAPNSAGNNAQLLTDGDTNLARWTIDFTDLPTVKLSSVQYTNRCLQRNSSAGTEYFATYTGTQKSPRLYLADSTEVQTMTFDAQGGTSPVATRKYVKGRIYWGIRKPEWTGEGSKKFLGWFDAPEGGTRITNYMAVTEADARTIYAHWGDYQTVYFDANGGSYTKVSVSCAGTYSGITKPTWTGEGTKKFLGWFDAREGGVYVTNGHEVTGDAERTLYAHWGSYQTVYFDANGGSYTKTSVECAGTYSGITKPTWTGEGTKKFLGWFDAREGGVYVTNGHEVTADAERTLYAHWGSYQTVYFDANGGSYTKTSVECAGTYSGITKPTWTGEGNMKFLGWFDAREGGVYVTNGHEVTADAERTLYAHWAENAAALAITGFSVSPRTAGPAVRSASAATGGSTLWLETFIGFQYEVQWTASLDGEWTVLKRWTADQNGTTAVSVDIPDGASSGFFRLVELGIE